MSVQSSPPAVHFGAAAMPYKGVAKVLKNLGYEISRQRGSHQVWKHAEKAGTIVVPRHGNEVAPKTVDSIAKELGLPPSQLRDFIRKPKDVITAIQNGGVLV